MELVTLNSNFQPEDEVENYSSLIWSERYSKNGDFELKSNNIAETIASLPLGTYVSLRETTVPMIVEDYLIENPKNDGPVLTVTGRTFDVCALERRASVNVLPAASVKPAWTLAAAKESDAAYKAMRIVLGDVARSRAGTTIFSALAPAVSPNDAIPEIDLILPADYSTDISRTFEIKPGNLYATVMELLSANNRGIKSFRPLSGGSKLGVEIYNGADLTELVVFDARFDQFDSGKYLLSNRGSTNVGYVYGPNGAQQVLKTAAAEPSGMDRRVLLVDDTSDSTANTTDIRKTRGLIELYKYNATALFDGEVAQQVAEDYNHSYFLGDILKLVGEYGNLSQNVRVAEFIRTSDNQGEKAYPTFEAVS